MTVTEHEDRFEEGEVPAGARGFRGGRAWRDARSEATSAADDPEAALSLVGKAWKLTHQSETAQRFATIMDDLEAAIRMVTLRIRGQYDRPALERVILLLAGLVYLVSPIDAIPDAIPLAGYLDDVAVLGWILGKLSDEVDKFVAWEAAQGNIDVDIPGVAEAVTPPKPASASPAPPEDR